MTLTDVISSIVLKDIGAIAQRDAVQSQGIGQNANAVSGASTSNEQTQTADITQEATASNSKDITIQPAEDPGGNIENFTVSVLVEGLFAGAVGNIDQGQGAAQAENADGDTVEISLGALEAEEEEAGETATEETSTEETEPAAEAAVGEETDASTEPGAATNGTPLTDSRASGIITRPENPSEPSNTDVDPSKTAVTGSRDVSETETPKAPEETGETGPTPEAVTDTRSSGIIQAEAPETEVAESAEEDEVPEAVTDSRHLLGVPASEDSEETEETDEAGEGEETEEVEATEIEEGVTGEDEVTDTGETEETEGSSDAESDEPGEAASGNSERTEDETSSENEEETPAVPELSDTGQAIEDQPPIVNPDELLSPSVVPQENPTGEGSNAPVEVITSEAPAVEAEAPLDTPEGDPTKESADEGTKEFNRAEEFAFDFGTPAGIFKAAFADRFINQQLTSPNGGRNRLEVIGTDLHDQVIGTKGLQQVPIATDIMV